MRWKGSNNYVIEHFSRLHIASSKHEEGWENWRQSCVVNGFHNFPEFSQAPECVDEAM